VPNQNSLDQRMNIKTIVWPIFVESLLRMSMMTIDVFMLARYSDDAVAAVGLTGHFIFFLVITYMIVSSGSAILIGQHLGAKNTSEATAFAQAGHFLAILASIAVGALFFFGSSTVVGLYNLDAAVENYAIQYLSIVGTISIGMSISIMLSTILRANGYSKSPMVIQFIAGSINVVGNYIALFAPFGIPETGVVGVAIATVCSQLFAAAACLWVIKWHRIAFSIRKSLHFDGPRLKAILRLGLPNGGEGLSYNLAQITIMFFVAQLGTAALAAAAIGQTLSRLIFVFSMSVGGGSQILASYMIGQNRQAELKRNVHYYWIIGVAVSLAIAILMALFREQLAAFFSSDPETQTKIAIILAVAIFLEPGRAINLIVIATLKGTGDVVFPVKVGILSMWGVGVLLAWVFGVHWAFGIAGIWIAVGLDEWTRGIIMIFRWQGEHWTKKQIVKQKTVEES